MNTIERVVSGLLDKGDLPDRIQVKMTNGPWHSGDVLIWSAAEHAYLASSRDFVVWASVIRRGWGLFFGPAPAHWEQGELYVA